jgi:hypothetical protein
MSIRLHGDVRGSSSNTTVVAIQNVHISRQTPQPGDAIIYDGFKYRPSPVLNANATSIRNVPVQPLTAAGQVLITQDSGSGIIFVPTVLPLTAPAGGDLTGTYPDPRIAKLQNTPINLTTLNNGDYLGYDSINNQWTNLAIPGGSGSAGGDLTGTYPNPTINKFQGIPLGNISTPTNKNILQYNGSSWVLSDLPAALPPNGNAGGDLGSTYPNPTVTGIQSYPVTLTTLSNGDYLGFDFANSQWKNFPAPSGGGSASGDLTGNYPGPITVAKLQGTILDIAGPDPNSIIIYDSGLNKWILGNLPTALPPNGSAGGDLGGTYPDPTIAKLQGKALNASSPADQQVLLYNSTDSAWEATTLTFGGDLGGTYPNPAVTGIQTIPVNLGTTLNDGDYIGYDSANSQWTNFAAPSAGAAGGDLTGNYPDPTIASLQGKALNAGTPAANQVLMYDYFDTNWESTTLTFGGDLTGSYPDLALAKISGVTISTFPSKNGQALYYYNKNNGGASITPIYAASAGQIYYNTFTLTAGSATQNATIYSSPVAGMYELYFYVKYVNTTNSIDSGLKITISFTSGGSACQYITYLIPDSYNNNTGVDAVSVWSNTFTFNTDTSAISATIASDANSTATLNIALKAVAI